MNRIEIENELKKLEGNLKKLKNDVELEQDNKGNNELTPLI